MESTNIKKIKQAVEATKKYPKESVKIEYNFNEEVDLELFGDIKIIENKSMERNSAKVIYKLV